MKSKVYLALIVFIFIPFYLFAADETLTITTYYPSPYGSYNEFKVASNTYLAYSSGSVGIGTTSPQAELHVSSSGTTQLDLEATGASNFKNEIRFRNGTGIKSMLRTDINANGTNNFGFYDFDAAAYRWVINNNGNVGIGTTGPGDKLEVYGGYGRFGQSSSYQIRIGADSSSGGGTAWVESNVTGVPLTFWVGGEKMRITSAGNVGIGTTGPGRTLDVNGHTRTRGFFETAESDGTRNGLLTTYKAITGAGTDRSTVLFAENTGAGSDLHLMAGGSATSRLMVQGSTGNVVIGSTSALGGKFDVQGAIYTKQQSAWTNGGIRIIYQTAGTNNYRHIYANSTGGALYFYNGVNEPYIDDAGVWHNASDISLKKNIVDIKYGLNDLMKLKPRSYQMKFNNVSQIGFVAQEVEKVIPELVSGQEGSKGLADSQMTAVIVKAMQEQQKEIEALKSEIQQLKAKLK